MRWPESALLRAVNERRIARGKEPLRIGHILRAIRYIRQEQREPRHGAFFPKQRHTDRDMPVPYRVTKAGWHLNLEWVKEER